MKKIQALLSFGTKKKQLLGTSKNHFGFTLVELIVVITILVILGTIGFISLQGFTGNARDSVRVTDIGNAIQSIDLSLIKLGSYPDPDFPTAFTYSGGIVWNQGTFGPGTITKMNGMGITNAPVDPLNKSYYRYSVLAYGQGYQIESDYEGDSVVYNSPSLVYTAYAASGAPTLAYIKGNYRGLVAKTQTGTMIYVIALPSIISNTGITTGGTIEMSANLLSGTLLIHGGSNKIGIPYNPTLVFSGGALPTNDSSLQITNMVKAFKIAYTGSVFANNILMQPFFTTTTDQLPTLGANIINIHLGGKAAVVPFICGTDTVSDVEGNSYNTVPMVGGAQCWMKSNMRTTREPDGTPITKANAGTSTNLFLIDSKRYSCGPLDNWSNTEDCTPTTIFTRGYLYQWSAAMNSNTTPGAQGICPSGWHVPTDSEWTTLTSSLTFGKEGSSLAGITGETWTPGLMTSDSTFNSSGFNLQPAGTRWLTTGGYSAIQAITYLWSSTDVFGGTAYYRAFMNTTTGIFSQAQDQKGNAWSVRCIKG